MKATIIKSKLHRDFTIVPNEILKRNDVSLSAKGLFCFIQSLPDDWVVYKNKLSEMTGESRRQINNAFTELESKGYLISVDIIRGGLPQKEYIFYQYPFNTLPNSTGAQNDTSVSTSVQNEQTDVRFEQTDAQNEHLLNTKLINTKLEKETTKTTTTESSDFFSFDEKLKMVHKLHKERLFSVENNVLLKSIARTSNKDFDVDAVTTFNTHLFVEKKIQEDFTEYVKHFRNWLGKQKRKF